MAKKNLPIKYTSRDFATIRQDLVDYAKRYYPDSYRDYSEAGFGSLMVDTVAYVGDILSFYLDYQANESLLSSAVEYDNVIRLAAQLGYKFQPNPTSYGLVSLYILAPANAASNAPDTAYMPILRKGSSFAAQNGGVFTLTEDVNFADSNNEIVVGRVNPTTGTPTYYAVKTLGQVMSGEMVQTSFIIDAHKRFMSLDIPGSNTAEIVSVFDTEGHEYFEVDYLSQDVVYREIPNRITNIDSVRSILKPVAVPRRFISKNTTSGMTIQFGYGSENERKNDSVVDPASVVLQQHARNYVTDETFDPSNLNQTDKFGIVPSNTTLFVTSRQNNAANTNVAAGNLTTIVNPVIVFNDIASLGSAKMNQVISSLEVNNDKVIAGDISYPTSTEIKTRALDYFATQNRIVTKNDYISYVYSMPEKFGGIKRAAVIKDTDSFKRNLNLYVLSEARDGTLVATNSVIKQNLKTWLNKNRMIHDTIDILDGNIINIGVDFEIVIDKSANKFDILDTATNKLVELFQILPDIGESFAISSVYSTLNNIAGVVDTVDVVVANKTGTLYSNISYDVPGNLSADGRFVEFPEDLIWEIKFPLSDIRGTIR
tara:strand:- start:1414 stop:3207 length:1794 start_codon:yes stop_codon:yes gene_type:complete